MAKKSAAGSIRQRPDGRWEARITTGRNPATGKPIRRSHYTSTQAEARKWITAMLKDMDNGEYMAPSKLTVGAWLDTWLELYNHDVKPSTLHEYTRTVELYLKPNFGAVKLSALTSEQITRVYNHLYKEGGKVYAKDKDGNTIKDRSGNLVTEKAPLSAKTVRNIHGVFTKALNKAVTVGKLRFNPAHVCAEDLPKAQEREIIPLDDDTATLFLKTITGHRFEILFRFALLAGLRRGELCGLSWSDVNFKTGTVVIRNQWQRNRTTGAFELTPPKNSKTRTLTPAKTAMLYLQLQRNLQNNWKRIAGAAWADSGAVFSDELGNRLSPQTVYCSLKAVAKSIGRPDLRLHDLRHTYAVMSLEAGTDLKTLQENMGHHSSAFTLDRYGHALDSMKRAAADSLDEYVKKLQEA